MLAPIVLFVYNRPEHTKKTVEALKRNNLSKESELFIFSDSWKDDKSRESVEKVRDYIRTIDGFKRIEIHEKIQNTGLANSITSGVTEVVNKYGKVIVLEDDLVTSPYFLEYMNEALDLYRDEKNVISIHGYIYPTKKALPETFFLRGADCWGWATWKRGWDLFEPNAKKLLAELEKRNLTKEFDFNGTYDFGGMLKRKIAGLNNSWAICWYAGAFLEDKLTLYPGNSLVQNIGQDASGTHGGNSINTQTTASNRKVRVGDIEIVENKKAKDIVAQYFKSIKPSLWKRVLGKILK